jgi:hypothetical protein
MCYLKDACIKREKKEEEEETAHLGMQAKDLHSAQQGHQAGAFYGARCVQQVVVYSSVYLHQTRLTHETCLNPTIVEKIKF